METVYMQQWQKLAKTRNKVNPRTQFWEDLTSVIQLARASNKEDLLMLDANADINDTGFSTFLLDCGLHDLHNDISTDLPPETYYRGTRKIDFCLGTQGVAIAVAQAGITAYEDGFKYSDHKALFVDLNEDALFFPLKGPTPPPGMAEACVPRTKWQLKDTEIFSTRSYGPTTYWSGASSSLNIQWGTILLA